MIDIENVTIDLNNVDIQGIYENLRILFSTPVGSVVLDRDFGIDWSIVDMPLQKAKAVLTIEYMEKVKKYEPRVKVTQVSFEMSNIEGILKPKVVFELVD